MALTTAQIRTLELAALGLPPNANAAQINTRLRTVTPGTTIDNRTGLPYTRATANDAGASGDVLAHVLGGGALTVVLGGIAAGLSRLGVAVSTGEAATGSTAAATGGEAAATATGTGASAATGAAGATTASNIFSAAKFASVAEFLTYVAWILNPHTLLRAVEFVVGLFIGGWGIYLLTSNVSGSQRGATARRIIQLSPAGRTVRMAQGRRMGRREGQREAARIESRQSEIRSIRDS